MLRRVHSTAGFGLALLLLVIASTGVILSFEPAANRLAYPSIATGISVAVLLTASPQGTRGLTRSGCAATAR